MRFIKPWILLVLLVGACGVKKQQSYLQYHFSYSSTSGESKVPTAAQKEAMEISLKGLDQYLCEEEKVFLNRICPVKTQFGEWCQGYALGDLIENLQSLGGERPESVSNLFLSQFSEGDGRVYPYRPLNIFLAMEWLQKNHPAKVPTEKSLPSSPGFFIALTRALRDYHVEGKAPGQIESEGFRLSLDLAALAEIKKKNSKGSDFLRSFSIPYGDLLDGAKLPQSTVEVPAFSYSFRQVTAPFVHENFNEILRLLDQERLSAIAVCGFPLGGHSLISTGKSDPTACGGHMLVIAGKRTRNGSCELLLKNSWGAQWKNGGSQWLSVKEISHLLPNGQFELLRLQAPEKVPGTNSVYYRDENGALEYVGQTRATRPFGKGRYSVYGGKNSLQLKTVVEGSFNIYGRATEGTLTDYQKDPPLVLPLKD